MGINQNSGTTSFGETVEGESKRRRRRSRRRGSEARIAGRQASPGKGKSSGGSVQCHRFVYPLNVAVRRPLVTFPRVVSGEKCKSLAEVEMKQEGSKTASVDCLISIIKYA